MQFVQGTDKTQTAPFMDSSTVRKVLIFIVIVLLSACRETNAFFGRISHVCGFLFSFEIPFVPPDR